MNINPYQGAIKGFVVKHKKKCLPESDLASPSDFISDDAMQTALSVIADACASMYACSHPTKLSGALSISDSHPIFISGSESTLPLLETASLQGEFIDFQGWSGHYYAAEFLSLRPDNFPEGDMLWKHLQNGFSTCLMFPGITPSKVDELKQKLLSPFRKRSINLTPRATQIFFPVSQGQYHLLTPQISSLMQTLFVRHYANQRKQIHSAEWRLPAGSFYVHGGKHPHTVSLLHTKNSGSVRRIPCTPPIQESPSTFSSAFNAELKIFEQFISNNKGNETALLSVVESFSDAVCMNAVGLKLPVSFWDAFPDRIISELNLEPEVSHLIHTALSASSDVFASKWGSHES